MKNKKNKKAVTVVSVILIVLILIAVAVISVHKYREVTINKNIQKSIFRGLNFIRRMKMI